MASVEQIERNLTAKDASERLQEAWHAKSRLRHAAALSLYNQELVAEFFVKHPLPRIEELLQSPIEAAAEPKKADAPERWLAGEGLTPHAVRVARGKKTEGGA
jgi:hypothetical protein